MPVSIQNSVGSGGVNNPDDVRAVKKRLVELGFDWLGTEGAIDRVDQLTVSTIKLFQSIKAGLNTVNGDGKVDVDGDTIKWLQAANAPSWQSMPAGSKQEGFINDEIADTNDHHDFGTKWLADTLRDAGVQYKNGFLSGHPGAATFTINDTSLPRGGNTPDHATHECGLCSDIKLPHKNGTVGGGITVADVSVYDQNAMRAMLKAFLAQPLAKRVLLNDPTLRAEGLCSFADGHENHAHFEIKPPARVIA